MKNSFTAVVRREGKWWIGWIEEVAGVNSQAKTRADLLKNLRSALNETNELFNETGRQQACRDRLR